MSDKGLGKLMPKSIAARRRKKHTASLDSGSIGSHGSEATENDGASIIRDEDDDDDDREESTSILSNDSNHYDEDSKTTTRPKTISTYPSQIGYLTTNSPIIQTQYSQHPATTDTNSEELAHGSTNPAGLAPPQLVSKRSTSPVGRFKGVFKKKSSSNVSGKGSSSTSSPERRPTTSSDSSRTTDIAGVYKGAGYPNGTPKPELKEPAEVFSSDTTEKAPEKLRRLSKGQKIDTSAEPQTPPPGEKTTPVIVNTPPTPTDTHRPKFQSPGRNPRPSQQRVRPATAQPDGPVDSNTSMLAQKRGRSGSSSLVPSKLSNITAAPLTPTLELGGDSANVNTNTTSSFFTSMFSAAQNAANTFSSTINTTNLGPGPIKNRAPAQHQHDNQTNDDKVEVEPFAEESSDSLMDSKEPAIKTLGMGDLNLSHLGINDPLSRSTTPTVPRFTEDAGSKPRSEAAIDDATPTAHADSAGEERKPRSLYESGGGGDRTPPTGSVYEEQSSIHRSGSIRSAIGRNSRKRGSTNGTGGTATSTNTIGAAIAAANASLAHPHAQGSVPKLTGFAVASKKRNKDFHGFFKSVPDDDYLIEDYSCALQREILAHGRLYVSEGHLCFSSNILGWVTTLVMSFDEIVSVEKRSTALLFKNGLMISTLHAKHVFASFTSRDSTYDLIVKIWKLGHPSLQSSLNGVRLDETGGDKTEKLDAGAGSGSVTAEGQSASGSEDESDEEDEDVYDEDEDEDEIPETLQSTEAPSLEPTFEKTVTRKPSGAVANGGLPADKPKDTPATPGGQDFPGPATHAPTDCGDADTHYTRIVGDDIIPAPLGKIFNMLFGPASVTWMTKWLTVEQKCTALQMDDKLGLGQDNRSRNYSYIKPLNGAIGPKQTKCLVVEQVENIDLEKAVNILVTTQTPDVPSGNVFSVKTKYCLSWAENNTTRVQINCTIEWTGKSWLKGPIENGANDGQLQHCKDLFASLKAALSARPRSGAPGPGAKGKKKGKKGRLAQAANISSDNEESSTKASKQDWGPLEPVHGIVGPLVDIIKPLLTGNVVYGLLVGLLVATWFGFGFTTRATARSYRPDLGFYGYPDRLAAYEEMWRREESELWEWLEERVGMDRLSNGNLPVRKRAVEPRTVEEKFREDRMDEREIREAIRVTEEKLQVLKSVVQKKEQ